MRLSKHPSQEGGSQFFAVRGHRMWWEPAVAPICGKLDSREFGALKPDRNKATTSLSPLATPLPCLPVAQVRRRAPGFQAVPGEAAGVCIPRLFSAFSPPCKQRTPLPFPYKDQPCLFERSPRSPSVLKVQEEINRLELAFFKCRLPEPHPTPPGATAQAWPLGWKLGPWLSVASLSTGRCQNAPPGRLGWASAVTGLLTASRFAAGGGFGGDRRCGSRSLSHSAVFQQGGWIRFEEGQAPPPHTHAGAASRRIDFSFLSGDTHTRPPTHPVRSIGK